MLINKELLQSKYIFVRSTNSKFLKYIMDMGIIPIIKYMPDIGPEQISPLYYSNRKHPTNISCIFIRPLIASEIKLYLNWILPFYKLCSYTLSHEINIYNDTVLYIDRDKL